MKTAITAASPTLDANVDPRFGRCSCFLIVETDDMTFEAIDNTNRELGQGAGIQSVRLLANRGIQYVLTGNCGPNAHQALTAAGIGVVVGCAGTVREVAQQFKAGQLEPTADPNVPGHAGMSDAGRTTLNPVMPEQAASGSGSGMGMGRGRGMGRGMGRGRGKGAGRGQGRGAGR
jgi:predicted Fe-Mo cluster-binding NifX family protein